MSIDGDAFASLVARAKEGSEPALTELYRRHHSRLLRVLRSEVGDAADDVASQTWLEVFGSLGRFEGDEGGFRALLFTVARRRVADHRRSRSRRPAIPVEPQVLHTTADPERAVDDLVAIGIDGDAAARRIVEILGEDTARVVLLRIVGGLSVDEVATIVGRSPGAVRVQQHRALKKLAIELGEGGDG
jgi:RNA polymerase sigma-70 factor (ECF subfamily)